MISCILLSAGQSQRFGSPKALAEIDDQTIIERLQHALISSQINELVIVTGAHSQKIEPSLLKHTSIKSVYNKDHNFGQTSSFITGLKNISLESKGIMLLPVDFPFIGIDILNQMADAFNKADGQIVIPGYQGKKGHPPIFPIQLLEEFLQLEYDVGINTIVRKYADESIIVDIDDPAILQTFNTVDELNQLLEMK